MPTPSLILVPARFKTGKLYTPVATTSGDLVLGASGDFNVTRATTATRVNASGLIESVASGIPRLDYYTSGGTAGCPALLVEASGTNFCIYSQAIPTGNVSGWFHVFGGNSVTVTPNSTGTLDPAGLYEADLIVAPAVAEGHYVYTDTGSNLTSLTSGQVFCWSFFAKSNNTTNPFFQLALGGMAFSPANPFADFVLSGTGSVSAGTYTSASIQNYGNGWYRCSIVVSAAANGTPQAGFGFIDTSTRGRFAAFTGDAVKGGWVYGAQFETGSIATSYIPTTAAAVTRNAEVITLSGAVSGCIGQTQGTLYAEVDVRNFTNGSRIVCLSDGTSDNRIIIQEGANSTLQAIVTNATSGVVDISTASGRTAGIYKIAIGYKQDDFAVYVNGSQTGTDNTGGVPACNQIFIGKIETTATTNQFNDRIRSAALYTTRLTNAELADLTT